MTFFCRHSRRLRVSLFVALLTIISAALTTESARSANLYNYTTISDPDATPPWYTQAYGLNNSGEVVGGYGYTDPDTGGLIANGYIYSSGSYTSFTYPYPPDSLIQLTTLN